MKHAESRLLRDENTKGYLGIDGLPMFNRAVQELLFGTWLDPSRITVVQTPGGTGGLRVIAEMIAKNFPQNSIWISQPTWPNHPALFEAAGLHVKSFPYLDATKTGLDLTSLLDTLREQGKAGELVCLHACCHNPTGIDPSEEQWRTISQLLAEKKMIPFLDFAYLGFGKGIEEDCRPLQILLEHNPEVCVALSFSKNFGLYSERVGASIVISRDEKAAACVLSQLKFTVRTIYSNPPRHGGSIVATIWNDHDLREQWFGEVNDMRNRIHSMRHGLVDGLRKTGVDRDFAFLLRQQGMFSYTGLNALQVDWLKQHKGVYMVGTGRINVAGLTPRNIQDVATAIGECIESTRSAAS